MNNKGFMMAEVVVVSAIILVTLTGLYVSYGKILSAYNQRVDYYDVKTLYELANYKTQNSNTIQDGCYCYGYPTLKCCTYQLRKNSSESMYVIHTSYIENHLLNGSYFVISPKFKDYLNYLNNLELNKNVLIMEKCTTKDNCKYTYLEVFN